MLRSVSAPIRGVSSFEVAVDRGKKLRHNIALISTSLFLARYASRGLLCYSTCNIEF
eukprot:m.416351 g.416351  ORF g.416351 m.416351 type:complete len:57 (-) comp16830_c1_seq9:100-270(-)